jgi:hypothetical protein
MFYQSHIKINMLNIFNTYKATLRNADNFVRTQTLHQMCITTSYWKNLQNKHVISPSIFLNLYIGFLRHLDGIVESLILAVTSRRSSYSFQSPISIECSVMAVFFLISVDSSLVNSVTFRNCDFWKAGPHAELKFTVPPIILKTSRWSTSVTFLRTVRYLEKPQDPSTGMTENYLHFSLKIHEIKSFPRRRMRCICASLQPRWNGTVC